MSKRKLELKLVHDEAEVEDSEGHLIDGDDDEADGDDDFDYDDGFLVRDDEDDGHVESEAEIDDEPGTIDDGDGEKKSAAKPPRKRLMRAEIHSHREVDAMFREEEEKKEDDWRLDLRKEFGKGTAFLNDSPVPKSKATATVSRPEHDGGYSSSSLAEDDESTTTTDSAVSSRMGETLIEEETETTVVVKGVRRPVFHLDVGTGLDYFGTLYIRISLAAHVQEEKFCVYPKRDMERILFQFEEYWFIHPGPYTSTLSDEMKANTMRNRFGGVERKESSEYKKHMDKVFGREKTMLEIFHSMFESNGMLETGDERAKLIEQRFTHLRGMIEFSYNTCVQEWKLFNMSTKAVGAAIIKEVVSLAGGSVDDSDLTDAQKLMRLFGKRCSERQYAKIKDQLYEQVLTPEGHSMNAYRSIKTAEDFLYEVTEGEAEGSPGWKLRTSKTGNNGLIVIKDFIKNKEKTCPILVRNRNCWAFQNVFWDAKEDKFYKYGDADNPLPDKVALKVIDRCYPEEHMYKVSPYYEVKRGVYTDLCGKVIYDENTGVGHKPEHPSVSTLPTLTLERLMKDQNWMAIVRHWLVIFFGRLSCEVGSLFGGDNWQMCPLLFGRAGTGKSTMARFALEIFEENDIFEMESSGETTFVLQNSIGKMVWCILELKKELRLSSNRYQQMVSGENMVIPRKGIEAYQGRWLAPGIMVGNDALPFKDAQGSIARRTIVWEFLNKVKVDTTIDEQLQKELPIFIRKAVLSYFYARDCVGKRGLWEHGVLPPYFKATASNLRKNVDKIEAVLEKFFKFDVGPDPDDPTKEIAGDKIEYVMPWNVFWKELKRGLAEERVAPDEITEDQVKSALENRLVERFILNSKQADHLLKLREEVLADGRNPDDDDEVRALEHEYSKGRSEISLNVVGIVYQGELFKDGEFIKHIALASDTEETLKENQVFYLGMDEDEFKKPGHKKGF